jgi:hypothetical protein
LVLFAPVGRRARIASLLSVMYEFAGVLQVGDDASKTAACVHSTEAPCSSQSGYAGGFSVSLDMISRKERAVTILVSSHEAGKSLILPVTR